MEVLIHVYGHKIHVFYNPLFWVTPEYIDDDPDHPIQSCPTCGAALRYEDFRTLDGVPAKERPIYAEFSKTQHF